ncbi:anhydro-N-acetylmuramic acid kinase, partial [bacterium]|nr:anhydro-N-acetylmuramic acid kinase [bacterium]
MSGTSYDGIDVCAISVRKKIDLVHFSSFKYPPKLRKKIASVIEDQILSLKDYGELDSQIGLAFAKAINKFIKQNNFSTSQIMAIGLSGQTLWHNPQGKYPFSIQAGDAAIISKECGIDVVHDFRNDHIALGGEGAPLVPEFHQRLFSKSNQDRLILNIGGISNYSYLTKSKDFFGSDSGPGNAL